VRPYGRLGGSAVPATIHQPPGSERSRPVPGDLPSSATGRHPAVGLSVAVGSAAAGGLALGLLMPRGPASTGAALVGMTVGLTVGAVAGAALRSRWGMLIAPVVFVVAFELVRVGAVGPTVDAPRLGVLGILAFLLGRGFDGVLILLPMVLGASLGAARVRRADPGGRTVHGRRRAPGRARRAVAAVTAVALVALAVALAVPARTAPIVGSDGEPLAGSVAELTTVDIGGHDQRLMIRGADVRAPVLLWLAGGPGGSDIGAMRLAGQQLEDDFVVVTWEQRGAGRSFAEIEPTDTMTLENAVDDTLELTRHLLDRFGQDKLYLAGNSWGTLPSVLAVERAPELFHAFVGAGQMVDPLETDRMFHEDSLAHAREVGDAGLEATLLERGAPPYDRFLDYSPGVFLPGEALWNTYPRLPGTAATSEMPGTLRVAEYSLLEKVRTAGGTIDTLAVLYPDIQDVDLRESASRLEVPVFLVQGGYEARGRAVLVDEWFAELDAPAKELIVFEGSGHRPMFEEPDRFHEVMTETVLASTRSE
jgi:proline iminopeptidase